MLSLIKDANIGDVKRELSRLLTEGSRNIKVRELAIRITPQYEDNQIAAVYDFVKSNVKYQPDPTEAELFIAPWKMVEMVELGIARGDCDDMNLFAGSLLGSLGYGTKLILLDTAGKGFDHVICEVYSDRVEKWIFVDTSSTTPLGWMPKYYSRMEVK